jgi:hypothetical protein
MARVTISNASPTLGIPGTNKIDASAVDASGSPVEIIELETGQSHTFGVPEGGTVVVKEAAVAEAERSTLSKSAGG